MHYILDNEGYVEEVSFGGIIECKNKTCSEYTGKVPTGYDTLANWFLEANIRAYKIVDGNLVYDANRDYKLKILYEQDSSDNRCVTKKELGMTSTEEINPYTDLYPNQQSAGGYITSLSEEFNKVGNLPTEEVNLSLLEEQDLDLIELEFIGNNFLPNTATSSVNNGIEYTQNKDKTIKISGTATERSTLNLAGTDTSVRNILTFKGNIEVVNDEGETIEKATNYLLFGLADGVSLEFYYYDGSDRTLVGIYNGGVISFEEDTNVTQVVLVVDKGKTIDTTIKPMLQLVGINYPIMQMTEYKGNLLNVTAETTTNSTSGMTYTVNADKSITINGTNKSSGSTYLRIGSDFVLQAGTYTLSNGNESASLSKFLFYDDNANFIRQNVSTVTFTESKTIKPYIRIPSGVTVDNQTIYPMIVRGVEVIEYEPYNGRDGQYYVDGISTQNGTPTPDTPVEIINVYKAGTYNAVAGNKIYTFTIDDDLKSVPNGIADRLWIDVNEDGTIDIEKKVGSEILDGSSDENWVLWNASLTNVQRFYINVSGANIKNSYCNKLTFINDNSDAEHYRYSSSSGTNKQFVIYINKSRLPSEDASSLKTYLSTNNIEVQYELNEYTTSYISRYTLDEFEYEEYKNNTTLIDLAGNEFTLKDKITIKDNQIVLIKNGLMTSETTKEEIYLGDTVMPRTYTPYTHAYCHQKVYIDFKYKDPRNVDITKINLKGLISITDIETEYNFCEEDLTKIRNYIMETGDLTDEEFEVYDVNGDGVIKATDYVTIQNMINGIISNKVTGTLEINSTQSKRTIVLRDSEGKIKTSLGLNGIFTPSLSVDGVSVEENITYSETPTTQFLNGKRVYKRLYTGQMPSDAGEMIDLFTYDFEPTQVWVDESMSFVDNGEVIHSVNHFNTTSSYMRIMINKSTKTVRYKTGSDFSSYTYNIVLSYTKDDGTEEEPETPSEDIVEVNKTKPITGSTNSNVWAFKTVATEESIDKTNKTSTITITNYLGRPSSSGSSYFMGTFTTKYDCGDQSYSETKYRNSGTIDAGGWYKLGSYTFTIKHTTEPMTINVGGSMSTSAFNPSSASASGSITLTEI